MDASPEFITYHKEFRRHAKVLLQKDKSGWQQFKDMARKLVRQAIQKASNNNGILLVPLVQMVVLKTSIHTLFELDIDKLEDDVVMLIAEKINQLWMKSKSPDLTNSSVYKDQYALKQALQKIFPNTEDTARSNPLNLILPAYETL